MSLPNTSKSVLVVEDDPDIRELLKIALEMEGHFVKLPKTDKKRGTF